MKSKSKVTLEMPAEQARKLVKDWKENPAAVKDFFKQIGFNIEDIHLQFLLTFPDK